MAKHCIITDEVITKDNDSKAHVIPSKLRPDTRRAPRRRVRQFRTAEPVLIARQATGPEHP
jgi:hypothetical protein